MGEEKNFYEGMENDNKKAARIGDRIWEVGSYIPAYEDAVDAKTAPTLRGMMPARNGGKAEAALASGKPHLEF